MYLLHVIKKIKCTLRGKMLLGFNVELNLWFLFKNGGNCEILSNLGSKSFCIIVLLKS